MSTAALVFVFAVTAPTTWIAGLPVEGDRVLDATAIFAYGLLLRRDEKTLGIGRDALLVLVVYVGAVAPSASDPRMTSEGDVSFGQRHVRPS